MADRGTRHPFLLMLVAALLVAACGGSSGPSANAGAPATQGAAGATDAPSTAPATGTASAGPSGDSKSLDGCEIVTAAEAVAVLGGPVTKSDLGTEPQQMLASCVWDAGAGTGTMALVNRLLQLQLYEGAMFYAPDQYKEMPGFEKVDGLGDGAFAYGTGSFDLVILAGGRTVSLGASGFTPDDRTRVRQAVLDLAPTVLGRIQT